MLRKASKPSQKRRDKIIMLGEGEIHYGPDIATSSKTSKPSDIQDPKPTTSTESDPASTSTESNPADGSAVVMHIDENHEDNNPLPDTTDMDSRDRQPWRNLKMTNFPSDSDPDPTSEYLPNDI